MNVYELLNKLNISYREIEHKAVYTIKEAVDEKIMERIEGVECKNLFLKSKNKYYLVFVSAFKKVDLKELARSLNISHFSFASEEELKNILGLDLGSVTPLGLINDKNNVVTLLIDEELMKKKVLVHPLVNTKTISIRLEDLILLIENVGHKYFFI